MEVFEAIKARHSVRSYTSDPVPDEVLMKLLEAARMAPSAGNFQPWRFIVVKSQEKRERIARGGMWARFASEAPIVIVAIGDTKSKFYIHDTCIALEHLVLTATSEGLGTCWIGSFNEEDLKEMLKIPDKFKVVALVSIGYPAKSRTLMSTFLHLFRPRKKLEEIAYLEEYGRPLRE
ncbi:MAG: nitroreductase family protein [Candidatus Bathyarchaeia archaeon]